jgi:hypothetical protein
MQVFLHGTGSFANYLYHRQKNMSRGRITITLDYYHNRDLGAFFAPQKTGLSGATRLRAPAPPHGHLRRPSHRRWLCAVAKPLQSLAQRHSYGVNTIVLLLKRYQFKTVVIYRSISHIYLLDCSQTRLAQAERRPALRVRVWTHDGPCLGP